jgi:A/G-specific adenine glycosylase
MSACESQHVADAALPVGRAWEWNQVIMDFGAQVCTARAPKCDECPVRAQCAWEDGDDPARASALTSKSQARFDGSDRQARGRLMRALTERGVRRADVGKTMNVDAVRAARLVDSLVRDGLVAIDDEWCRLA